jgi:hypothetical protein
MVQCAALIAPYFFNGFPTTSRPGPLTLSQVPASGCSLTPGLLQSQTPPDSLQIAGFYARSSGFFLRHHAASSSMRTVAGPSMRRGLVWINRSSIAFSAIWSSRPGARPTARRV